MRRVLVALDDSEVSHRVAEFVNKFFEGLDVHVLALNVSPVPVPWIPPAIGYGGLYTWWPARLDATDTEEMTAAAEAQAERTIEASGIRDDAELVEFGDPVTAICEAAIDHQVDLIVVGTHDKSALRRLISGSVSTDLVHQAPCPVLVVR